MFALRVKKPGTLAVAVVLVAVSLFPIISSKKAAAYGLFTDRAIKMSSSAGGATDVTYSVTLEPGTTQNVAGLVIDFCVNTPVINDTCTTGGWGFDINEAGLALANQTGLGANNFSIDAATDANTLVLTRTSSSLTAGTAISFDLGSSGGSDGVTNPVDVDSGTGGNQVGSFYARIVSYTTAAGAQAYTSTSIGAEPPVIDAGGIALSTAAQITVTAKVAERLVFCVYTTGDGNDCTTKTGNAITLGNTNGVLDPLQPFVNAYTSVVGADNDTGTRFSITTNATGGAIVRMKGTTLTNTTSQTISPNATPATSNFGNEQFGVCLYQAAGTGLTVDDNYDGDASNPDTTECSGTTNTSGTGTGGGDNSAAFTFDDNGTTGTTSTYGDEIASKIAGNYSTANLSFIGNISNSTEPGIYTTVITFIATGTY